MSSGKYLGGGSLGFTNVFGCGDLNLPYGLGAACNLDCFDGWCDIDIDDDVNGDQVGFRVCLASGGCYAGAWFGHASVPGDVIHVVPSLTAGATTGMVYVR